MDDTTAVVSLISQAIKTSFNIFKILSIYKLNQSIL